MKKGKELFRQLLRIPRNGMRALWYKHYYKHASLDGRMILIDSKNGKDLGSNMLRIAEELCQNPRYDAYKIYVSCNENRREQVLELLKACQVKEVKLVKEAGFAHYKILAMAKYIFTDTSFPAEYVKKDGQMIVNTWHGTPLKNMGRDDHQLSYNMGNVQKSQLQADYLVYPSEYMCRTMCRAYCMEQLYDGVILPCGYPRNSIFFSIEKKQQIRSRLGLEGDRVYSYMPTWRGNMEHIRVSEQLLETQNYLRELDTRLEDREVCFVRLHPFVAKSVEYSGYTHIRPFPEGYEPYEILNASDVLVTDYSSVFFDFANTGSKIVLFVYDRANYEVERGLYLDMKTLPFPVVGNVEELLVELRSEKEYEDVEFREKFCTYDQPQAAAKLCRQVLLKEAVIEQQKLEKNGRGNLLVYLEDLGEQPEVSALLEAIRHQALGEWNYYVTFLSPLLKDTPERVNKIPPNAGMLPLFTVPRANKKSDWEREYRKYFGELVFDAVIYCKGGRTSLQKLFENEKVKMFCEVDEVQKVEKVMGELSGKTEGAV